MVNAESKLVAMTCVVSCFPDVVARRGLATVTVFAAFSMLPAVSCVSVLVRA
jgi:hypothetical protein